VRDIRNDDSEPQAPDQRDTQGDPEGAPGPLAEEIAPAEEEPEEEEARREESEVEVLQKELALLEGQLRDMRDRYIRAVADLDNARKRARQEIAEARKSAAASVILDVLGIVDNLERALETAQAGPEAPEQTRAVYEGVSLIYRQFMDALERRGVKPIRALGERFDPKYHEAVAQVPASGDQRDGTIALEMQRGYLMGDRVLRPSRVGVVVREAGDKQAG